MANTTAAIADRLAFVGPPYDLGNIAATAARCASHWPRCWHGPDAWPAGTLNGTIAVFYIRLDTDALPPCANQTEKNSLYEVTNKQLPNKAILK